MAQPRGLHPSQFLSYHGRRSQSDKIYKMKFEKLWPPGGDNSWNSCEAGWATEGCVRVHMSPDAEECGLIGRGSPVTYVKVFGYVGVRRIANAPCSNH